MKLTSTLFILFVVVQTAPLSQPQPKFYTQYGEIPLASTVSYLRSRQLAVECYVDVELSSPPKDGMEITLDRNATWKCGAVKYWRIWEYKEDEFVVVPILPLPSGEPLVLDYHNRIANYEHNNADPEQYSCEEVDVSQKPLPYQVRDFYDVEQILLTEECKRIFYDIHRERTKEEGYQGREVEILPTVYRGNRRMYAYYARWLIEVKHIEHSTERTTLLVVEAFNPKHGNARFHAKDYADVDPEGCPPGDWRDVIPFDSYSWANEEYFLLAHDRAFSENSSGRSAVHTWAMEFFVPNDINGIDGWLNSASMEFRVVPGGPYGCLAMAKMIDAEDWWDIWDDEDNYPNLTLEYLAVWRGVPVWYQRPYDDNRDKYTDSDELDLMLSLPSQEDANWVYRKRDFIPARREGRPDGSEEGTTSTSPDDCTCPESSTLDRRPTRSR